MKADQSVDTFRVQYNYYYWRRSNMKNDQFVFYFEWASFMPFLSTEKFNR